MHPAIVGAVAVVALGAGFLIGYAIRKGRQHAELEQLTADQQSSVQLYLRRKVAETGVDIGNPNTGTGYEEVLQANVTMANALLDHDRKAVELGDTQEFGLASTMRLQSTEEGAVVTGLPVPDLPTKPTDT